MPTVTRHPAPWAVHTIYMIPSDYVLKDRFGVAQDEAVFFQRVEDQVYELQQWFWDITGGRTFATAPATYYRCSLTTAQIFATYVDYFTACVGILAEMASKGLYDPRTPHRLPNMYLPLDIEGAGNSNPLTSIGSPWFPWGSVMGAGAGGRLFGGMFPNFLSPPTTITAGAAPGATTLTVATGTGKNLAVAAKLHFNSSRVNSVSGSPTTATQIVCADVSWVDTTPLDAVVWPYGPNPPTSTNAEAIQVTAVNTSTKTLTVVRGRYGTTPIAIAGGGTNGGGSVIGRRNKSARIWTSPATPEGAGFEVVNITSISGDTLTVQRGQKDAYVQSTTGTNTTARTILAGDNLACTENSDLWFYQNQRQATGAFARELGHNFGMTHYTPAQVIALGRVGENRPSVDSVTGVDFWEHLPDTPNNPLTPGNLGPFIMYSYWDYPFASGGGQVLMYALHGWYPGRVANAVTWPQDPFFGNASYPVAFTLISDRGARQICGDIVDEKVAVAPSPATSGTTIGVPVGMGQRISQNVDITLPATARIWGSAGSFDDPATYEQVTITAVTGDTLTLTRAGSPRSIAVGDNIALASPGETTASRLAVARGALAHEIGHALGLSHPGEDPADPNGAVGRLMGTDFRNYPGPSNCFITAWEKAKMLEPARPPFLAAQPVGSTEYAVRPVVVLAGDSVPSVSAAALTAALDASIQNIRAYYQSQLGVTFKALPSVVATVNDTEANRNQQFPNLEIAAARGGVPFTASLNGFTANEMARVLASPYLSAQARP